MDQDQLWRELREASAKVADRHKDFTPDRGDFFKGYKLACADIARDIRALPPPAQD